MTERHIIVGAGQAGRRAAETLRALRTDLDIVLIGDEPGIPYDRPLLSKDGLADEDSLNGAFIQPAAFYEAERIDLRTGLGAVAIDRAAKTVRLADGTGLGYDKALLATGSRVRRLTLPGAEDAGVCYLRTLDDARALRRRLFPGVRVMVIGGGFIGLEAASTIRSRFDGHVTVLEATPSLLGRAMPAPIGDFVAGLHRRNGVDLRIGVAPLGIRRDADGGLTVRTTDGDVPCDVIVAGIGVVPNVELAEAAGLLVRDGIVVDEHGRTSDPDIFAAGDVTQHYNPLIGRSLRVESWQVAEKQAPVAAACMCGADEIFAELPWLWSDQFDCNIQTLGDLQGAVETVMRGDASHGPFSLFALDASGCPVGVVTIDAGRDIAGYRRLIARRRPVSRDRLADASVTPKELLAA